MSVKFRHLLWMLFTCSAAMGAFRNATTFPISRTGMVPLKPVTSDFNRDGIPDVAYATLPAPGSPVPQIGGVSVLLGARNSPFTAFTELPSSGFVSNLVTTDFNRDNLPDIGAFVLTSGSSSAQFCAYLGNGSGGFSSPQCTAVDLIGGQPIVADFNRDSIPDVAIPRAFYNSIVIMLGNGNGTFRSGSVFSTSTPFFIAAGDWTGDGSPDLAIYSQAGSLLIARGNGLGGFTAGQTLSAPPNGGEPGAADLDGDGRPEIVIPGPPEGGPATIFRSNGTGLNAGIQVSMPSGIGSVRRARFADADNDGDLDIWITVLTNAWGLLNDGRGGFALTGAALALNLVDEFVFGDFNADGLLDIVSLAYGQNGSFAIALYGERSTSTTQLTPPVTTASYGQPVRLVATLSSTPGADVAGATIQLLDNGAVVATAPVTALVTPPTGQLPPFSVIPVAFANFDVTLPVGAHLVSAYFPGTVPISPSTSPTVGVSVTRASSNIRLSSNEFTIQRENPAAIPVNVDSGTSPAIDGTVRFVVNGQPMASAPVTNGLAQLKLPSNQILGPVRGSMQFESANYLPSSSPEIAVLVQGTPVYVSAAYPQPQIARDGIVTLALPGLTTEPQATQTIPWPTKLSRVEVELADAASVFRAAPLAYAGPNQINLLIPAEIPEGQRALRVKLDGAVIAQTTIPILTTAPGIFTANSSGSGVPAALAGLYGSPGIQDVPVFTCAPQCVPAPMSLGTGDQVLVVSLYATGFRNSSLQVNARAGATQAEVLFAGPHPTIPGLDQINVKFDRARFSPGEYDLVLTVDGKTANTVRIAFR